MIFREVNVAIICGDHILKIPMDRVSGRQALYDWRALSVSAGGISNISARTHLGYFAWLYFLPSNGSIKPFRVHDPLEGHTSSNGFVIVSYLTLTSKFIVHVSGSGGVRGGRKNYIGSDRTSLLLVTGGLCYRDHWWSNS